MQQHNLISSSHTIHWLAWSIGTSCSMLWQRPMHKLSANRLSRRHGKTPRGLKQSYIVSCRSWIKWILGLEFNVQFDHVWSVLDSGIQINRVTLPYIKFRSWEGIKTSVGTLPLRQNQCHWLEYPAPMSEILVTCHPSWPSHSLLQGLCPQDPVNFDCFLFFILCSGHRSGHSEGLVAIRLGADFGDLWLSKEAAMANLVDRWSGLHTKIKVCAISCVWPFEWTNTAQLSKGNMLCTIVESVSNAYCPQWK